MSWHHVTGGASIIALLVIAHLSIALKFRSHSLSFFLFSKGALTMIVELIAFSCVKFVQISINDINTILGNLRIFWHFETFTYIRV